MNEIFRRTGEPSYHTPIAVIGELVKAAGKREKWQVDLTISEREQARTEFNQSGGQVTIINQPFGEYREPPHRAERKNWKKSWRWFGIYFTLSSCRVKLRTSCHDVNNHSRLAMNSRDIKGKMYEKQEHRCPHCGKEFPINRMELHHVLPWARFPEMRTKRANQLLLCHDCHKEIHCNPYLNIRLMEEKAKELGIDLKERYDYGTDVCREEDHRESVGDSGEE